MQKIGEKMGTIEVGNEKIKMEREKYNIKLKNTKLTFRK